MTFVIDVLKKIKKIYSFFFNEVGFFNGNINYIINKAIHRDKYLKRKNIEFNNSKVLNKEKFKEYGWSEIYLGKNIREKTFLHFENLKKNDNGSNKSHWRELFKNEKDLKNYIAGELLKTNIFDFAFDYFQSIPMLRNVNCFFTEGTNNHNYNSSMNWHKDLHHKKLIKIMYFVNDVNEENGPTSFFDKKKSSKIRYINFPDYFSDNDLKLQNLKFDYETCLGSSGEAYAIDTANCFHMGSRSKKDRLQIIIAISPYASTLYPHKSIVIDKDLIDFNHSLYSKYKSQ
jgi:hypothetical protein